MLTGDASQHRRESSARLNIRASDLARFPCCSVNRFAGNWVAYAPLGSLPQVVMLYLTKNQPAWAFISTTVPFAGAQLANSMASSSIQTDEFVGLMIHSGWNGTFILLKLYHAEW